MALKPEALSCFPRATGGAGDSWHMQSPEALSDFLLRVPGGCRAVAVGLGLRAGAWPKHVSVRASVCVCTCAHACVHGYVCVILSPVCFLQGILPGAIQPPHRCRDHSCEDRPGMLMSPEAWAGWGHSGQGHYWLS